MEKKLFFEELKDSLELEGEINERTPLCLTSIEILTVMAFIDENFDKQIKASELKNISSINDIMMIIGLENIV